MINDVVFLKHGAFDSLDHVPLLGVVVAETAEPDEARVLWENGLVSINLPQDSLAKIFDMPEAREWVGKYVQLNLSAGEPPFDQIGDKSPASSGIVVRAFGIGNYDAESTSVIVLTIAVDDGRRHLTTAYNFLDPESARVVREQPGRRVVAQ